MADPDETTGTNGQEPESSVPDDEDAGELDVVDTLMAQVATLQELAETNAKWLAVLEPRIENVEQQVASQLALGQDYNRLDAQVSGLQAAVEAHHTRPHPVTISHAGPDVEVEDPVQVDALEGSLGTLESGTGVVLGERRYVVVGPAREGTVKVRPWGGRGEAQYLPASRIPDEVLSE